jgi:hypothetical protein
MSYMRDLAILACVLAVVIAAIYLAPVVLQPKPAYVEVLYDMADTDMDGKISMEELMTAINWYNYYQNYTEEQMNLTIERWKETFETGGYR